jgi:hypothetical protein
MVCDILDIKCVIVNELIGSATLAILMFALLYFVVAAKIRLGFKTTIAFSIPLILAFSTVIIGFSVIYAIGSLIAGLLLAMLLLRLLGNK